MVMKTKETFVSVANNATMTLWSRSAKEAKVCTPLALFSIFIFFARGGEVGAARGISNIVCAVFD